jgi:hypothetical protein
MKVGAHYLYDNLSHFLMITHKEAEKTEIFI